MGDKQYFVYMMTNRWKNVLYVGVTNSLERRVWQHKYGDAPGFTKKYNCNALVYYEIYDEIEQAIAREKQLKRWSRGKKDQLIAVMNREWTDLAADWYREVVDASPESGDPSTSLGMTRVLERD
jgi:putative endonuclease